MNQAENLPSDQAPASVDPSGGISRRQVLLRGAGLTGAMVSAGGLASLLAACGSTSSTATTGGAGGGIGQGGTLKAALTSEPDTLDPAKSALSSSFETFTEINQSLVQMDPEGEIVPAVAAKWTELDDVTYEFELRDDVTFHNGDKVTGEDVKYSLERILAKETASPWAANLSSIKEVEVNSPSKVTLHLGQPYAPLLTILARNAQIVSKRAIESGDPDRKPVGCGPFELTEWASGDHITLTRYPGYFEKGLPHVDEIRLTFLPTDPASVEALRAKEVNYLSAVPANLIASVQSDPDFNFTTSDKAGKPYMLAFNLDSPQVDNESLRQAIAWAIDRDAVNQVAFFGAGEPGSMEVGSGSVYYGPDPYSEGPDLDLAKKLLAESGLKTPVKLEYMATAEVPEFGKMGEVIRDQLKPLGIEIDVQVLEGSVWLNRLLAKDYQLTGIFNETVSDPDQMYSLMILSGAELNLFNYSNPDCDAAIEAAREESDVEKRKALYEDVRQFVFDQVPIFYMHYDNPAYLANTNVLGVTARPTLELALDEVGFETE